MFLLRLPSEAHEQASGLSDSSSMFEDNGNKCGKCQNHDFEVLKKGHARECPFKRCNCNKCRLLDARSDILQVISGKETKLKGTKKDPHCGFCQNHGVMILRKGHVRSCGFGQERHFRLDNCFDCKVHYIRNEVNRLQIKMRRAMKEDKSLSEEQRKATRDPITREEVEKVCDMARIARKEREELLLSQQQAASPQAAPAGSSGATNSNQVSNQMNSKSCASPIGSPLGSRSQPVQQVQPHSSSPTTAMSSPSSSRLHQSQLQFQLASQAEPNQLEPEAGAHSCATNLINPVNSNQFKFKFEQHKQQHAARTNSAQAARPIRTKSNIKQINVQDKLPKQVSNNHLDGSARIGLLRRQTLLSSAGGVDQLTARSQVWRPWSEQQVAVAMQAGDQNQLDSFLAQQFGLEQQTQESEKEKQDIINLWAQNQQGQQLIDFVDGVGFRSACSPPESPRSSVNNFPQQQVNLTDNLMLAANLQTHNSHQQQFDQIANQQQNHAEQNMNHSQQMQQQMQLANAISFTDQRNIQEQFNGIFGLILAQIAQLKDRSAHD